MRRTLHAGLLVLTVPFALLLADCLPSEFDEGGGVERLDEVEQLDEGDERLAGPSADSPQTALRERSEPSLAHAAPIAIDHCEVPGSGILRTWTDGAAFALPLLHTDIDARISGMVADVSLVQTFVNPFPSPIEATYVFPLPQDAAVDGMTLRIGDRVIEASVHERHEAKEIYEQARDEGRVAARLDQERPNVFEQHIANLMPGAVVEVELHLVQPLSFEDGGYDWTFPLVVGPRYTPDDAGPNAGVPRAPDSPTRTGNDVSIAVSVDAGLAVSSLRSPSHDVRIEPDTHGGMVSLSPDDAIANKDFVLRYEVGGAHPEVALLAQHDEHDSVFMLMIQPPADAFVTHDIVTPKEMVFVVDTSCSMSGYPLDKARDAMTLAIDGMNPDDRFLVMDFNDKVSALAPRPLPNTLANRRRSHAFVDAFRGSGGTRMLDGIEASLNLPSQPDLLRTVVFLTDGYIGNEADILAAIDERLGSSTRLYSLGIGSSVNRYLLESMAKAGRGDVEYVLHAEDADRAVENLYERIRNPIVTDLAVDFGDADVHDVFPDPLADLFAGQPLVLMGRYSTPGPMTVTLTGRTRQGPYEHTLTVDLPARAEDHPGLPSLWARKVVEDLESRNRGGDDEALNERVLQVALDHGLMTRLTSMVAVDTEVSNPGGAARTHGVPLETPDGVQPPACPAHSQSGDLGGLGGYGMGAGLLGSGSGSGGISGLLGGTASGSGGLGSRGIGVGGGGAGYYGKGGGLRAPRSALPVRPSPQAIPSPERSGHSTLAIDVPEAPTAAAGETMVLGSIDKSVIDRVVRQQLNGIRACYQRGLQLRPDLGGKVVARFVIGADGSVSEVTLRSSTLGEPTVQACIQGRLAGMTFPAPPGGGIVIVSYPFVFSPADE